MKKKAVLVYKNNVPYMAVDKIEDASKLTRIPYDQIYRLITSRPKKEEDVEAGGRSTKHGWGFDYLA